VLLLVFAIAIAVLVFEVHVSLAYLILVPVVWAALSFEQAGAAVITVLLATMTVAETVSGHGPFASGTPTESLVSLQIFNAIVAFAGLSLACVVSGRRRAEVALKLSEVRYRRLFERANDPIWMHDLDGKITYANPAAARTTGYSAERLAAMSIFDLAGSHQEAVIHRAIRQLLEVGETTSYEIELRGPGGTIVALELSAVLVREDEPVGVQLIGRDVTARNITEGQLRRNALRDPVTGLPNRTLLIERLQYVLAIDDDAATGVALMVLDIDDFGRVNSTDGRGAGDALLRSVGHRLDSVVRASDTVARIGGDEFAVILSPIGGPDEALEIVRRLIDAVRDCSPSHPTVCVGFTVRDPDIADVESLLRRADLAMRHAKRGGAASIEMYGSHIEPDAEVFEEIRTRLERSLER
jgi:diguanylate cyclase (GGDEF)-like protein/PAS domain S-box-containing protein